MTSTPAAQPTRPERSAARGPRVRGLIVIVALCALGILFGSQWWKTDELRETLRRNREAIASAPSSDEGRVALWLEYANPQIHSALRQLRLSPEHPWLATHALRAGPDEPAEVHGIDLSDLPLDPARVDGLVVTLRLPEPRALGLDPLAGDAARFVPVFAPGMRVPDAGERARLIVRHALQRLPEAVEKDVPGARFEIAIVPGARTFADLAETARSAPAPAERARTAPAPEETGARALDEPADGG